MIRKEGGEEAEATIEMENGDDGEDGEDGDDGEDGEDGDDGEDGEPSVWGLCGDASARRVGLLSICR
jgi:hypothetical protein